MKKIDIKMPPNKWGLFLFLIASLIHLIILVTIYYDIKFVLLLSVEFVFFIINSKFSLKIIYRILMISGIIFILNFIFNEGKIINDFGLIKITYEGMVNGFKKSGFIASTLFFTYNTLHQNKSLIINYLKNNNNNIIIKSINYFFIFLELINDKTTIKRIIIKIILIYKNKYVIKSRYISDNNLININFCIYHIIFIIIFICIFIYSCITV